MASESFVREIGWEEDRSDRTGPLVNVMSIPSEDSRDQVCEDAEHVGVPMDEGETDAAVRVK